MASKEIDNEILNKAVELPSCCDLHYSFNIDMRKTGNVYFVEEKKLVFCVGNTIHFFDIETCKYTYQQSLSENGIGAICVHREKDGKTYLAVGCIGDWPKVYIYEYPKMEVVHTLSRGTETKYTALSFDQDGNQLATVGNKTDYLLTIWDWRKEKIILRYKAHGQDVFKVAFSPSLSGHLTTSGIGHIKFWKMAQTFTGLKLKGEVGKFGKVDISNIVGFAQFPDGKVLSGSEQGNLILWEENIVKVVFVLQEDDMSTTSSSNDESEDSASEVDQDRKKGKKMTINTSTKKSGQLDGEGRKCHDGMITQVQIVDNGKKVMTSGHDGTIKFWDFYTIDTSEATDNTFYIPIKPLEVIKIKDEENDGTVAQIVSIVRGDNVWVVQDRRGKIWKLDLERKKVKKVKSPETTETEEEEDIVIPVPETKKKERTEETEGEEVEDEEEKIIDESEEKKKKEEEEEGEMKEKEKEEEKKDEEEESDEEIIESEALPSSTTNKIPLIRFLSGDIKSLDTSPIEHLAVVGGSDGVVRLVDYVKKEVLYDRIFNSGVSVVFWNPLNVDPSGRSVMLGFENGVVRHLRLCVTGFQLIDVQKPHSERITSIGYAKDSQIFFSCSVDRTIFFFHVTEVKEEDQLLDEDDVDDGTDGFASMNDFRGRKKLETIGFSKFGSALLSAVWTKQGSFEGILTSLESGDVFLINPPDPGYQREEKKKTYEIEVSYRKYLYIQHIRPPEREPIMKPLVDENNFEVRDEKTGETVMVVDEAAEAEYRANLEAKLSTVCPVKSALIYKEGCLFVSLEKENGFCRYPGMRWQEFKSSVEERRIRERKEAKRKEKDLKNVRAPVENEDDEFDSDDDEDEDEDMKKRDREEYNVEVDSDGDDDDEEEEGEERIKMDQSELEFPYKLMTTIPDGVCTSMSFSRGRTFLICGYSNGKVRLVRISGEIDRPSNDLHQGEISRCVSSFDDSFVLSVGVDSCFFVQKVKDEETKENESDEEFPKLGKDISDDILRVDEWSIEESRIKSAEEKKLKSDEEVKEKRRLQISELRKEFQKLKKLNNKMIPDRDLQLDNELEKSLQELFEKKVGELKESMSYETEKADTVLKRLQDHFLNNLDYERIVVFGFENDMEVSTFKARKTRDLLRQEIEKIHEIVEQEMKRRGELKKSSIRLFKRRGRSRDKDSPKKSTTPPSSTSSSPSSPTRSDISTTSSVVSSGAGMHLSTPKRRGRSTSIMRSVEKSLEKVEDFRRAKEASVQARKELMDRRQKTNEVDPQLVEKIAYVSVNMGDYGLKMSDDYEITESNRETTSKKFTQMVLLEDSLHTLKCKFNEQLVELRDLKEKLVKKFRVYNSEIRKINEELGIQESCPNEKLFDDEVPEKVRYKVSDRDLRSFREKQKQQEMLKEDSGVMRFVDTSATSQKGGARSPGKQRIMSPGHASPTMTGIAPSIVPTSRPDDTVSLATTTFHRRKEGGGKKKRSTREQIVESLPRTVLEHEFSEMYRIKRVHEKAQYIRKKKKLKKNFDRSLENLREEKFKLEIDIKQAELRFMLLYKEYELLKQYEKKDQENYEELRQKREQRNSLMRSMDKLKKTVVEKKKEIQRIVNSEKIEDQLERFLLEKHPDLISGRPDSPKKDEDEEEDKKSEEDKKDEKKEIKGPTDVETMSRHLKDIFFKRKRSGRDEDSDFSDDEDMYDDYDSDDEGGGGGGGGEEEEQFDRPDLCPKSVFLEVLALRREKLQQEEELEKISKEVKGLRSQRDQYLRSLSSIDKQLKVINERTKNVQMEKQKKLNELDTMVVLKLHQIRSLEQQHLPKDLSDHIVFPVPSLKGLIKKEKDIKDERIMYKNYNRKLGKRLKITESERTELDNKFTDVQKRLLNFQLLKFGQEVDYEDLILTTDEKAEQLRAELEEEEITSERLFKKRQKAIKNLQKKMASIIRENTKLLNGLATLREKQEKIEMELNDGQISMIERIQKGTEMENKGRERLRKLKRLAMERGREIERGKNEIAILRSKTAHVYTQ